jgi:tRNA threonylcarbamoyladenosine biosynthesis protein TsaE
LKNVLTRLLRTTRETRILGAAIARALLPGDVTILSGGLGAGKTFLARSVVGALGGRGMVTSPTFTLVHEHSTPRGPFVHADLYRLLDHPGSLGKEVAALGLVEKANSGAFLFVEWGESALLVLPPPALFISLEIAGPRERTARLWGARASDIV